jgi:hypothetical protein
VGSKGSTPTSRSWINRTVATAVTPDTSSEIEAETAISVRTMGNPRPVALAMVSA